MYPYKEHFRLNISALVISLMTLMWVVSASAAESAVDGHKQMKRVIELRMFDLDGRVPQTEEKEAAASVGLAEAEIGSWGGTANRFQRALQSRLDQGADGADVTETLGHAIGKIAAFKDFVNNDLVGLLSAAIDAQENENWEEVAELCHRDRRAELAALYARQAIPHRIARRQEEVVPEVKAEREAQAAVTVATEGYTAAQTNYSEALRANAELRADVAELAAQYQSLRDREGVTSDAALENRRDEDEQSYNRVIAMRDKLESLKAQLEVSDSALPDLRAAEAAAETAKAEAEAAAEEAASALEAKLADCPECGALNLDGELTTDIPSRQEYRKALEAAFPAGEQADVFRYLNGLPNRFAARISDYLAICQDLDEAGLIKHNLGDALGALEIEAEEAGRSVNLLCDGGQWQVQGFQDKEQCLNSTGGEIITPQFRGPKRIYEEERMGDWQPTFRQPAEEEPAPAPSAEPEVESGAGSPIEELLGRGSTNRPGT